MACVECFCCHWRRIHFDRVAEGFLPGVTMPRWFTHGGHRAYRDEAVFFGAFPNDEYADLTF